MSKTSALKENATNGLRTPALEKLDRDFSELLERMKPFVLQLRRKAERQKIAMWIKKLCEPPGNSLSSRKNRNMYGQVLLAMLKRDLIEEPFSQQPEPGLLPTMPPYMSIYVDETSGLKFSNQEDNDGETGPSWLKGEFESDTSEMFSDELVVDHGKTKLSSTKRSPFQPRVDGSQNLSSSKTEYYAMGDDPSTTQQKQSPYKTRRVSGGKMRYEPVYLREILDSDYPTSTPNQVVKTNGDYNGYLSTSKGTSLAAEQEEQLIKKIQSDREVDVRTKIFEAKFHEDKLKLQQQHDLSVQKILDRKNCELEEVKSRSRTKLTELEARVKKQERRIVQQAREIDLLKEQREKQVNELKDIAQEKGVTIQNNFEKKLHDKIAQYEQEKFDMQKKHTKDIQDMLEETNERVQKMEQENAEQVESLNALVKNLEEESCKLSNEYEAMRMERMQLEQDKVELETEVRTLKSNCDDLKQNVIKGEKEREKIVKSNQHCLERFKNETISKVERVRKEKEEAVEKLANTINGLKDHVGELQRKLKEIEFEKQKEIHELAANHRQEKTDLTNTHNAKIRALEDEIGDVIKENEAKISKLEAALSDKNEELEKCYETGGQKIEKAEKELRDFKRQMEENTKKIYDGTKIQMDKVEKDLEKSKMSREKQTKEFTRQIESERIRHEKIVAELKISFEQEKTALIRDNQQERETLLREHEKEREVNNDKYRTTIQDLESQSRIKSSRDAKVISELQQGNCDLREELMQKETLYKQQLVELGMLREEEKQTYKRQEEMQATKAKSEVERQRLDFQRQHSLEMEQLLDKTNTRFKQMEEEYTSRSRKTQETIGALRDEIQTLKNERVNLQGAQEKRFNIALSKHEEEKNSIKNHHATIVQALERDLQRQITITKEVEKQAHQVELNMQEKMSKLRFEYEEKLRGLLPVSIKQELEDTISSLRQQLSILQSRANVLQEELDASNTLSSTWDVSRFEKDNIS